MPKKELTGIDIYRCGDAWAYNIRINWSLQDQTPANFGFSAPQQALTAAIHEFDRYVPPPERDWEADLAELKKELGI